MKPLTIPLVDLKAQNLSLKSELEVALNRVIESGQFVLGQEVEAFEEEFARYIGTSHAIGVNSGTSALHLALLAVGVGPGDEVVTVPFTFVATAAAIEYTGARPVFVDIDPCTYTMDTTQLLRRIGPRTKAIVPVHLYGQPADMTPILDIAAHHGLSVIEDAAQAHGARYSDANVGALGNLGCFSFFPSKNLGAFGQGGMVVTSSLKLAQRVRSLRNWGGERKYQHVIKGFNYRLDPLQAAVLRVKLEHLNSWNDNRRRNARQYSEGLKNSGVDIPKEAP